MTTAAWTEADVDEFDLGLVLDFLRSEQQLAGDVQAVHSGAHSNDVLELRLAQDRRVMVKRGRHEWARERFAKSRDAARAIRSSEDIVVPEPFALPERENAPPLQAYWRIRLPTLKQLWPRLDEDARIEAMRSWGWLIGRLHSVRVPGWGESWRNGSSQTLLEYFDSDLGDRLLRSCHGVWQPAVPTVERLLAQAPRAAEALGERRPTLAHNDMHMSNVLCEIDAGRPRCVGLLDLEDAVAAPPESDLASLQVLHGPHFEQQVDTRWLAEVPIGYGDAVSPVGMRFFRALHLVNLGFYSALIEHHEHAGRVLGALCEEVERLED